MSANMAFARELAIEDAANLCEEQGALYTLYAGRQHQRAGRSTGLDRKLAKIEALALHRDAATCWEMARLIRARLRGASDE